MRCLVIAEHDNAALKPSTLNTLAAAGQIGAPVDLLVAGGDCAAVAGEAAAIGGVAAVLLADAPHLAAGLAENLAALVVGLAPAYSHILAPATTFGKNFLPRVAALLDVAQVSDIIAVESPDTFVRLIYAGSAVATVQALDPVKVVSVRTTGFDPVTSAQDKVEIRPVPAGADCGLAILAGRELTVSARPELSAASIIVSGGRGLQSGDNFKLLEALADRLGAAIGASRAAVDSGFVPNDYQVGQTGKIVAPQLYIAVGISGAIQHLAGMKDSKVIVAINKDPDAPIFQVADYGLVADLFQAIPELIASL